jgi:glycosyltransferase involved in cell wall biosynthesis
MTMERKVSIGMPSYNAEAFIGKAIKSVLDQTYKNIELIICDDLSDDNTEGIIRSINDPRIKFIRNEKRLGIAGNFNNCLSRSTGDYFCIFNDDDLMCPDNIEKKVNVLDNNKNVGMVFSFVGVIDKNGRDIDVGWPRFLGADFIKPGREWFNSLLLENNVCTSSALIRKECFDKLGGFDERLSYSCDLEVWMKIALFYDVAYLAQSLAKFRLHADNASCRYEGVRVIKESHKARMMIAEKYHRSISDSREYKKSI